MARPHVSESIVQLRRWVTAAAALVVVCLGARLVTFGFVHYTGVRQTVLRSGEVDGTLRVVDGAGKAAPAAVAKRAGLRGGAVQGGAVNETGVEVNRVQSAGDLRLAWVTRMSGAAGIVGACGLALCTLLGAVVAGGASVQGVERATKSAVWAWLVMFLCLPWETWGSLFPVPGAFAPYEVMTGWDQNVEIGLAGSLGLHMRYVMLPLALLVGTLLVAWWFHTGVERGVILTTMSEMDEAIEREMANIRKRGVTGGAAGTGRAITALNRTIADGSPTVAPITLDVPASLMRGDGDGRRPI
ncbi:MAG: hypothetical protein H7Y88_02730 [Phycisphaerales bacterium]|nr:hypothetical protein [Phycisphaerales bacterium]